MTEHQVRMAQEHGMHRVADFQRQAALERQVTRVSLRSRLGRALAMLAERLAPDIYATPEVSRPSVKEAGI